MRVVGQRIGRLDGADKVTGAARYSADVTLPGMVWGKALRSPLPHARIVRVDAMKARALPGVLAVLTAADVPDLLVGRRMFDMPLLARDRVRFIGEKVAVVAALDPDIAEEALALIEVEYEDLPAVFDPVEAIQAGAPLVHDNPGAYQGARRRSGRTRTSSPSSASSSATWTRGSVTATACSSTRSGRSSRITGTSSRTPASWPSTRTTACRSGRRTRCRTASRSCCRTPSSCRPRGSA
jgi:CO/xanthine dehydrogenase Mo-binding subunit